MKKTKVYETPELIVTKFEVSEKIMDSGSFFETTNPNEKPGDIVTKAWESTPDVTVEILPIGF